MRDGLLYLRLLIKSLSEHKITTSIKIPKQLIVSFYRFMQQ